MWSHWENPLSSFWPHTLYRSLFNLTHSIPFVQLPIADRLSEKDLMKHTKVLGWNFLVGLGPKKWPWTRKWFVVQIYSVKKLGSKYPFLFKTSRKITDLPKLKSKWLKNYYISLKIQVYFIVQYKYYNLNYMWHPWEYHVII